MAKYLLVESRDPFEWKDSATYHALAADLAKAGNQVTLFLVQNGVLTARPSTQAASLTAAMQSGVEVLADEFSLKERGIPSDRLVVGVKPSPLDVVVDQLAEGRKALFH
ncbi:MAG TPA: DsrE family protein [Candidatus Polarisedimenticolia bacterium]|nr:DsrE family protein [Candidatus Polarisedimenticolia bacterium]